ncbi:hypothetical protein [Nesterenkonia sp. F]|uniref:hypothetical protein n=1 Tax=Nesterenkonia sp. F TaxID=795955 RepID=UPI000255D07C|nr:hypothetical protein [Nesterenkonia sp. F]
MIVLTLMLTAAAAAPAALSMLPQHRRPRLLIKNLAAVAQLVLLAAAALCALAAEQTATSVVGLALTVLITAAAAAVGGSGVSTAVLDSAAREHREDPAEQVSDLPPDDRPVLRGGAWIGVLERLAAVVTLLAAWPEGLAVVLAVKGLARYSELRRPNGAAERFIIGTFCSVLWASACAGIAMLVTA